MAYTITNTLTNLTASGDTTITSTATVTLSAASGYRVPASVTVSGADYTYDDYTDVTKGVISLSNPTGNVTITAVGLTEEERFNADMDGIADVINAKAGTTGDKYLPQIKHTAGTITTAKTEQTKTVSLSMAGGDQTITPDTGKVLTQVTVEKPATLAAGNIKDGTTVGGVTGTFSHVASNGAMASDILSGKKAYVNGSLVTGNIASKSAQTYTPTTSDQTIAAGQYLSGAQTVKGDANLVAGNIKKDVTIFGTTGSYEGGGGGNSAVPAIVGFEVQSYNNSITATFLNETSNGNAMCVDTDGNEYDGTNGVFQYKIGYWDGSGTWTDLNEGTTAISAGSGYKQVCFRFLNTLSQKPFGVYTFGGIDDYEFSLKIENSYSYGVPEARIDLRTIPNPTYPVTLPVNFFPTYQFWGGYGTNAVAHWIIAGEED